MIKNVYLLHAFTLAYILYLNDRCTCVLLTHLHKHCDLWNANAHIHTPTSRDAHTYSTHTHTSASEDFFNGRPVSFHGNRDRQILYVLGSCSVCVWVSECVCVCIVSLCVSLGWQSPRDRLQAWHPSDNHCSYFHTIQTETVPLKG